MLYPLSYEGGAQPAVPGRAQPRPPLWQAAQVSGQSPARDLPNQGSSGPRGQAGPCAVQADRVQRPRAKGAAPSEPKHTAYPGSPEPHQTAVPRRGHPGQPRCPG